MPDEKNDSGSVDLSKEEFLAIQNQIANLNQKLAIAESVVQKEKLRSEKLANLVTQRESEFENYRKRTNEANKKQKEEGAVDVIEKILPLLDTMKQGIMMVTDEKVADGFKMIYKQFHEMLGSLNVTEIPALGEQFDPNLHNAVMQVKVKDPENVNVIVEVFNKGYRMGDRVIRHSVVKVGK